MTGELNQEGFKMTELGLLPEEWEAVKFSDCRAKQKIKIPPSILKSEYKHTGKYPVVDQGMNFIAGYTNEGEKILKQQLPVIIFGDHTRIFKFVDFPFAIGADGTKMIFPKIDAFKPKFLYYYFLNLKIPSKGYNRHFKLLKESIIARPPLLEQKKIAVVLSAVQEAKEKTDTIIQATRELKKSLMKHLFSYGVCRVDGVDRVKRKETEIGLIPEEWEVVKVKDVFELSKKPRNLPIDKNEEIPFIPMELISQDSKSVNGWQIKKYSKISSGTFVFKNDLIVAKITPSFENGKQAILDNLLTDYGYATTEVWAFHPRNGKSIVEHLYNYLKIQNIRVNIASKMEGATGRQRLPHHVIESLQIPLPSLPIQQKIADTLYAVDRKIEAEENKKKALEELFKTLLNNLMTGKIRVTALEVEV